METNTKERIESERKLAAKIGSQLENLNSEIQK
jgi:hypothetical protein